MKKYIIAYCNKAYAMENGSANMKEEEKRKVRIAAGGIQAIYRLRKLLNPFRYGILSFQYVSHRVLRWSITPIALFLLVPLNVLLIIYNEHSRFYIILLVLQLLFYAGGSYGYYLLFMNINVIKGFFYFIRKNKNDGTWEKVRRAV